MSTPINQNTGEAKWCWWPGITAGPGAEAPLGNQDGCLLPDSQHLVTEGQGQEVVGLCEACRGLFLPLCQ